MRVFGEREAKIQLGGSRLYRRRNGASKATGPIRTLPLGRSLLFEGFEGETGPHMRRWSFGEDSGSALRHKTALG